MAIVQSSDPNFPALLDTLCLTVSPPPFYSAHHLAYYEKASQTHTTNLSAIAVSDGEPIAAFLVMKSEVAGDTRLDYFGNPAFLISAESAARKHEGVTEISSHYTSSGMRASLSAGSIGFDVAMTSGFLEKSTPFVESIFQGSKLIQPWIMRKRDLQGLADVFDVREIEWPRTTRASFKQALKFGIKTQVLDQDTPRDLLGEMFWKFRQIHFLAAGRKTRSETSWEEQLDLVSAGNAFVVIAEIDGNMAGGAYFTLGFESVYYGVAANHPDFKRAPIGHVVLERATRHSIELGQRFFWAGQVLSEKYRSLGQKEINIEQFKFAFGNSLSSYIRASRQHSKG